MVTKDKKPRVRKSQTEAQATSEGKVISRRRQISDSGWADVLAEKGLIGTNQSQVAAHLGNQLCSCLWLPEDIPPQEFDEEIWAALLTVMSLAPRNELEAMLAVQAVAAHNAGMECMRRAMFPGQSSSECDLYLKHAEKLFRIFKEQAEVIGRNQRDAPQLTAGDSGSQSESEEAPQDSEGEDDDLKVGQSDNLLDIRALLEEKKAS